MMTDSNGDLQPPTARDWEGVRIYVGAGLILASMLMVYLSLGVATDIVKTFKSQNVSDVVAVLGSITTFLGTAVGLFFGINVGQAGKTQAVNTANAANNTANVANSAARAAQAVAQQAGKTAETANAQKEAIQSSFRQASLMQARLSKQLETLRTTHSNAIDALSEVQKMVTPEDKEKAKARVAAVVDPAVKLTAGVPADPLPGVSDYVTGWLAPILNLPATAIDTSLTLTGAPPGGCGLTNGTYQSLCNDCEAHFGINLPGDWRDKHATGSIDGFIADVATLVSNK